MGQRRNPSAIRVVGKDWNDFLDFVTCRALLQNVNRNHRESVAVTNGFDPLIGQVKFGSPWRFLDKGSQIEAINLEMIHKKYASGEIDEIESRLRQMIFILVYRHNLVPKTTQNLLQGRTPSYIAQEAEESSTRVMHDCIKIWPRIWVMPHGFTQSEEAESVKSLDQLTLTEWAVYCHQHYHDVLEQIPWLEWLVQADPDERDLHVIYYEFKQRFPRLGAFKVYEVLTSLTYLGWWGHSEWNFVHVGHGALPAVNRLAGVLDESPEAWLVRATLPVRESLLERGMVWPQFGRNQYVHWTPRTLEDCLCEWRKYFQIKEGTREPRLFDSGDERFKEPSTIDAVVKLRTLPDMPTGKLIEGPEIWVPQRRSDAQEQEG